MVFPVIATLVGAAGGSLPTAALIFAAFGGFSGVAAILTVYFNHKAANKKAEVEEKSVAIEEIEKVIPGMGEIIQQWQGIVDQLRVENARLSSEAATLRQRIAELEHER